MHARGRDLVARVARRSRGVRSSGQDGRSPPPRGARRRLLPPTGWH